MHVPPTQVSSVPVVLMVVLMRATAFPAVILLFRVLYSGLAAGRALIMGRLADKKVISAALGRR